MLFGGTCYAVTHNLVRKGIPMTTARRRAPRFPWTTRAAVFCLLLLCAGVAQTQPYPADLRLVPVVAGLVQPLGVRHAGDPRLFVIQQGGQIRVLRDGSLLATPFLDLNVSQGGTAPPLGFSSGGERGLLGLAFAPDYAATGLFYLYYTDGSGDTVVARYRVSESDPDQADPASGEIVLRIDQDFANHNGGDIHFGLDGMLYIALGDGGSGFDPCNRGQTLRPAELFGTGNCAVDGNFVASGGDPDSLALLGKLLRIDVSSGGTGGGRCGAGGSDTGYGIPADNPYAAVDGICDEIYASGLRNPYRFSVDRLLGDLWIGDVGQREREEINRISRGRHGLNLGWRCREGLIATPGIDCSGAQPVFTDPVVDHPRSEAQSITGGYRYRGPNRALRGLVFYGDFSSGRQFVLSYRNNRWQTETWRNSGGNPAGYGEDLQGNLYLADYGGTLFRLEASDTVVFASGMEPEE